MPRLVQTLIEALDDANPYIDHICGMIQESFGIESVTVCINEGEVQWYKYGSGLAHARCNPGQGAMCQTTIDGGELFEVTDTLEQPGFRHHFGIVNAPLLRYYAGIPLVLRGRDTVGTLCLWDDKPHESMGAKHVNLLVDYSMLIARELELIYLGWQLDQREVFRGVADVFRASGKSVEVSH